MPLYNPDGNQQPPFGKRDYWQGFRRFVRSDLHEAFLAEISRCLNQECLNSRWLCSQILKKLQGEQPNLFERFGQEQVSGLFGMTLWNYIAQRTEDWYFTGNFDDSDEMIGVFYFRKKEDGNK